MLSIIFRHQSIGINTCKRSIQSKCVYNVSSSSSSRGYRRVVVTGFGLLSPLGIGATKSWSQLIASQSGVTKVKDESRYKDIPCKIAAYVPEIEPHLEQSFSKSQLRTYSRSALYAILAAKEALEHANYKPANDHEASRSGVAIGSGMVDFEDIQAASDTLRQEGYGRLSPHFITQVLLNLPAGHVSMQFGLRGPNHTVSTACTTGTHSVGDAFNFIRHNAADLMVCGGVETPINPLSLAAFSRIRALCTKFNDNPTSASRPFDQNRCGFVMGEGAAMLILEELQHAKQRNAKIYGEILGYGLSGDAHHITAPREDGQGAKSCMRSALDDAKLELNRVGHINCHATSTPLGDQIELTAIKDLFGDLSRSLALTSTKSSVGHLLGAAGATEAIFALLACHHGLIPPTLNLDNSIDNQLHIVAGKCEQWTQDRRVALSNSFGFGGTNASLAIGNFIE